MRRWINGENKHTLLVRRRGAPEFEFETHHRTNAVPLLISAWWGAQSARYLAFRRRAFPIEKSYLTYLHIVIVLYFCKYHNIYIGSCCICRDYVIYVLCVSPWMVLSCLVPWIRVLPASFESPSAPASLLGKSSALGMKMQPQQWSTCVSAAWPNMNENIWHECLCNTINPSYRVKVVWLVKAFSAL